MIFAKSILSRVTASLMIVFGYVSSVFAQAANYSCGTYGAGSYADECVSASGSGSGGGIFGGNGNGVFAGTGMDVFLYILLGLILVGGGIGLFVWARRRKHNNPSSL